MTKLTIKVEGDTVSDFLMMERKRRFWIWNGFSNNSRSRMEPKGDFSDDLKKSLFGGYSKRSVDNYIADLKVL